MPRARAAPAPCRPFGECAQVPQVRREGEERITFLARVRNLAMAPLYEHYSRREDPAWPLALDALTWSPDYILVISDTWVCWGDMLRLINHRADIACGLDFMQCGRW